MQSNNGRRRMRRRRKRWCKRCRVQEANFRRPRDGKIVGDKQHDLCLACFRMLANTAERKWQEHESQTYQEES